MPKYAVTICLETDSEEMLYECTRFAASIRSFAESLQASEPDLTVSYSTSLGDPNQLSLELDPEQEDF